jgi:adenylate cyclase class 2
MLDLNCQQLERLTMTAADKNKREKNTEVEVKVYVASFDAVRQRLVENGAQLDTERLYEYNIRYEDRERSMTAAGRVLRLRRDSRCRLTYKEPLSSASKSDDALARTELEVQVSDFDTTDLLLRRLGFEPSWVYEKYRTTYHMFQCEVVLDEMPFGLFVEVEGAADDISRTLLALGLANAPRILAGYGDLFARVKERLNLDFQDLTFENFRGVHVPDNIFV